MTTRERPFVPYTLLVVTVIAFGGCRARPDFHRPAPPAVERYTAQPLPGAAGAGSDAQRLVTGGDVPAEWWTLFRSPQLDALIARALDANPDLAAATAALRVAQENLSAGKGALYPNAGIGFNASRQRNAGTLASPLQSGADYFALHTAQVSVSWAPDLFGGTRRGLEALRAQADVQRFQLAAARLSLTANVVVAAINEAGLRAQMATTQGVIADQRQTLESLERQFALGAVPEAAVAAQQAALAGAEAGLPPLRKQLEQQRDALAALLGEPPSQMDAPRFELADLHLPPVLPLTLPARLVERRPDVLAAEATLHVASAQVGVAVANRLPKLVLGANAGSAAADLTALFSQGTSFWELAAGITEPVFDAGSLKHQQRAAEAAFDQAKAQYRATVIAALQNVADTLHALRNDADALAAARTAEQAAARSLAISRRQFAHGDVSHVAVLQAEQTAQQAELALVQAQVGRYSDSAALVQALGGGGWHADVVQAGTLSPQRDSRR
ncbi:MAG: efflux transporter outer membrane subunit [Nevskiaceae bacterium]|nr:MAG: efflux transporter outer membrane subunit [Nevskiaceae bacterium]TBR73132.1 MAG: efflux transporter outer membrane subunit [Nevskiaceae bacterium]